MSPQFRKVHLPLLLPITDQFPYHQHYLRCGHVMSVCLGRFMECNGVLPTTQFAYRKRLGTHTLQSALQSGRENRIVQIDFIWAFDRVNHQGILYRLCSVGIGGSVVSILIQFLLNRSQHITVDGCQSKLVNVLSEVPQGSVLVRLLFLLYTSDLFPFWKLS